MRIHFIYHVKSFWTILLEVILYSLNIDTITYVISSYTTRSVSDIEFAFTVIHTERSDGCFSPLVNYVLYYLLKFSIFGIVNADVLWGNNTETKIVSIEFSH